jgi:UDP-hydrolysing UDP-N-acetyl-D-glucosamine 2-epimerase
VLARDDLRLSIVCFGSAVLDRYGQIVDEVRALHDDVYTVATLVEGDHAAMCTTAGITLTQLGALYGTLRPEVVVIIGDRYEMLPAAYAATLQNIRICHTMGGEISGTVDEATRHSITKLSQIHCVATTRARERVIAMGEDPARVYQTGCPRIDGVREACSTDGPRLPRSVLVGLHPVTTESVENNRTLAQATLEGAAQAAKELALPLHVVWPNPDAYRDVIARVMRDFPGLHMHRKLDPATYARSMRDCAVMIGNSSSGIREGSWLGTPYVLVGNRQRGRELANNALEVRALADDVAFYAKEQANDAKRGLITRSDLYGSGHASERIAAVLAGELPGVQKTWRAA